MSLIQSKLQDKVFALKQSGQKERYSDTELRVSELVFCPMKSYIYRKHKKYGKSNGIILSGVLFHEEIPTLVEGIDGITNPQYEVEVKSTFKDDHGKYKVTGHCDVLTDEEVIEFKFSNSMKYKNKLPIYYHEQVNYYTHGLDRDQYSICVVGREDLKVTYKTFKYSSKLYNKMLDRIYTLRQNLTTNTPPLDRSPYIKWECSYCPFLFLCNRYRQKFGKETMKPFKIKGSVVDYIGLSKDDDLIIDNTTLNEVAKEWTLEER